MTVLSVHPDKPVSGEPGGRVTGAPRRADVRANAPTQARTAALDEETSVEASIERVYDRCAEALYRLFMARTSGDTHLSRDLMQQLFLAALKTGREVPEHELEFWLRTVARRLLATHWRRAKVRQGTRALDDAEKARELDARLTTTHLSPQVLDDAEARRVLMQAITDLPVDDQTIIFAHYFEGAGQAQIGERLGISARAVEGRLYRARAQLRVRLQRFEDVEL